ncbi:MAG: VCBS repeat-containing protein [Caldilineaceae bacterium]|nr:VCBS repeat-containing protein [Caldilineaceae bacterium]
MMAKIYAASQPQIQQDLTVKLNTTPDWYSATVTETVSIAWGDVDNDGDLDLAVGNGFGAANQLYINENGILQPTATLISEDRDNTSSIAWGDVDNDGDLDLAVGNRPYFDYDVCNCHQGGTEKVYLNEDGNLQTTPTWISSSNDATTSIAWGDVDGDGDLDLAIGNEPIYESSCECYKGGEDKVYLNEGGRLQAIPAWISASTDVTTSIAWGDVDGDGDLDLATGNRTTYESSCFCYSDGGEKIYLNESGHLQGTPNWNSQTLDETLSISWGDFDNDGDPDLAVGNLDSITVYKNQGTRLQENAIWRAENYRLSNIAWVDIDGDGDLDLSGGTTLYLNQSGVIDSIPIWNAEDNDVTSNIAWGDVDADGDLDLAAGNDFRGVKLYLNNGVTLNTSEVWNVIDGYEANAFAWGDVDRDGDIDLAAGNGDGPSLLYLNDGGALQNSPTWMSEDSDWTYTAEWGDVDGDHDLDLAIGGTQTQVYLNDEGVLSRTASWTSEDDGIVSSVAWGDLDNDGDMDLAAVGDNLNLYLNTGKHLQKASIWSIENMSSSTVAWADIDGDSDLDLSVVRGNQIELYLNDVGILQNVAAWTLSVNGSITSIIWGDVNGDGLLDCVIGVENQSISLYLNKLGGLQKTAVWSSNNRDGASQVMFADIDSDGDLDLTSVGQSVRIYLNDKTNLQDYPAFVINEWVNTVAWADIDGDGHVDLTLGSDSDKQVYLNNKSTYRLERWLYNQPGSVVINSQNFGSVDSYSLPNIYSTASIPITYTLFHPGSEPVSAIRVYYSLDGSFSGDRSNWRVAEPTSDTQIANLSSSPYPTRTVTNTHVFHWDVWGSGFFGQSDNVVLRIEALPNLKPVPNGVPGPYQHGYVSTQSFPFRVRGTQIRVVHDDPTQTPARRASIYRLPVEQTQVADPVKAISGKELQTDQHGYLQGRGRLKIGDRLFALAPISATEKYTVYHTSAAVTPTGLEPYTVNASGIQTLTVSSANTFLLYNLVVSLEWDARNDPTFMTQLENDLRRTSQILYDLTNGQAALGDVRIYHDKGFWGTADVVIAASNNQRPNAILGGSVLTPTTDVDINGNLIPDAYVPGQVRMGATWNRFGNPNGTLGEDWPRTLAHELGHYLFFVPDNYIGVSPDRQFVQLVDCQGSVMTDPYEESYSEFLTIDQWHTDACQRSVAAVYLGRPDWDTITRFYPMLDSRGDNPGPSQLPLAVTRITTLAPPQPSTTLAAPFFPLINQQGQTISVADGRGQAYLFKTGANTDPTDDYLIALGTPIGDLVQARGAAPGDRLCVFDYEHQPLRIGCLSPIGNTPSPVALSEVADWSPQIQVSGINTNTVVVTVTNVTVDNLAVQLLPAMGVASAEIPMTQQGNAFVQTVTAADGAYFGFVRIWAPGSNPIKEMIVEYSANEAWDGRARAWGGSSDAWGGRARAWGGRAYGWGGRARAWGAPVMSSDGQVSIFPLENPFAGGVHYTLQTVAFPPTLPTWLTPVGQAYRIVSDGTLSRSAILFNYLSRDVPDGYENLLNIYYSRDEGQTWQRLATDLDTYRNQASGPVLGEGIYLLVATIPLKPALSAGWNSFGYPAQASQPIAQALASIDGKYTIVHHYRAAPAPTWQTYAPDVAPPFDIVVNDLEQMELGQTYWLYATEPITLYVGVGDQVIASSSAATTTNTPSAPAIFYGWIEPGINFSPVKDMTVTAQIDGDFCGETTVQLFNGRLGYVMRVAANESQQELQRCGIYGEKVTFFVGDRVMAQTSLWNNQETHLLSLSQDDNESGPRSGRIYLPIIRQ